MVPRTSPNEVGPEIYYKPLDATIGRVVAPILAIGHTNAGFCFCDVFHRQIVEKGF
jgi:hypothetical protein